MSTLIGNDTVALGGQPAEPLRAAAAGNGDRSKTSHPANILSEDEKAMLISPGPPQPLWRRVLRPLALALILSILAWMVYYFLPDRLKPAQPSPPQVQAAQEAINAGNFTQAFDLLEQAGAKHPGLSKELTRMRAQAFLLRAAARVEQSPREAQEDLRAAARLEPGWAQVYLHTGRVLTKLKKYDEALAAYRRALRLDNKLDTAWFNAGYILMQQNKCAEAMDHFHKVVALDSPHAADAHLNVAVCLVRMGENEEALEELKLALVKNPNHKLAQEYMAKLRERAKGE